MKQTQIILRISEIEKAEWQAAAASRGQSLSEFIRFIINMKLENARSAPQKAESAE